MTFPIPITLNFSKSMMVIQSFFSAKRRSCLDRRYSYVSQRAGIGTKSVVVATNGVLATGNTSRRVKRSL